MIWSTPYNRPIEPSCIHKDGPCSVPECPGWKECKDPRVLQNRKEGRERADEWWENRKEQMYRWGLWMMVDAMKENRKQSLYFPEGMVQEVKAVAKNHGVSVSKVVQDAWEVAKGYKKRVPGTILPFNLEGKKK